MVSVRASDSAHDDWTPTVDVVLPAHNEEGQLAASVTALRTFLDRCFPYPTRIVVADNASTDGTWPLACRLAAQVPGVDAFRLERKGRGGALRAAWSRSRADVVAYMDVDLSTGLPAFLPLVAPLLSGHSDVALGTRLAPGARVVRGVRRELVSRGYNLTLRAVLGSTCTDAQCGFKAMRRDAASEILALVRDDEWFFDTELLVVAQHLGLRIHEVPVDWVDDPDSRVDVLRTAWKDLRGMARLVRAGVGGPGRLRTATTRSAVRPRQPRPPRVGVGDVPLVRETAFPATEADQVGADELLRVAGVGIVSWLSYLALVAVLRTVLGIEGANVVAVVACTLGGTRAFRRRSRFGETARDRRVDGVVAGGLVAVKLAGTVAVLSGVQAAGWTLGPVLVSLAAANVIMSIAGFAVLRTWVFRPRFGRILRAAAGDGWRPARPSAADRQPIPTGTRS